MVITIMFSRRAFLQTSFFGASQLAMPVYARQFNQHAKNEADVMTQMIDAQYPNFILVNKGNGILSIIDNGYRRLDTPVIVGKRTTPTPSGVFSLINTGYGSQYPEMEFYHDATGVYLLHGLIAGRERAILKDDPRARQLSKGCINSSQPSLDIVLKYARDKAKETRLATPIAIMPERYSPTQFGKMVTEFKPQFYTAN